MCGEITECPFCNSGSIDNVHFAEDGFDHLAIDYECAECGKIFRQHYDVEVTPGQVEQLEPPS